MANQDQAVSDEQWLQQTLGPRYRGCELDEDEVRFRVTVEKRDRKWVTFYAATPEEAIASARFWIAADETRWRESTRQGVRAAAAKGARTRAGASTHLARSASSDDS